MHISCQPLWNTLKECGMRKEDLRLAAGLSTNMIANMGKDNTSVWKLCSVSARLLIVAFCM